MPIPVPFMDPLRGPKYPNWRQGCQASKDLRDTMGPFGDIISEGV
jgi:hypothetical protein